MGRRKKTTINTELSFYDIMNENFAEFIQIKDKGEKTVQEVISTGVLSLDISTGVGGIPTGRYTEIYGPESSGKTTLILNIAKEAINSGYNVLYVDPEQGVDMDRAEEIIGEEVLNPDRFYLVRPKTMEQALLICENGIKSNNFKLIVLDSIGGMSPQKVHDDDLEDNNVALVARRLKVFLDRNSFDVMENKIAFVGINQIRDRIGTYYSGWETPGGHSWKHLLSMRIELRRMEDIKRGKDEITGILTKFVIKKNKVAPPYRSFYFPIMFKGGIDSPRDVLEFSIHIGVIVVAGAYYSFEDETLAKGFDNTLEKIKNDPILLDKIVKMCYSAIDLDSITVEEQEIENGENVEVGESI